MCAGGVPVSCALFGLDEAFGPVLRLSLLDQCYPPIYASNSCVPYSACDALEVMYIRNVHSLDKLAKSDVVCGSS